MPHMPYPDHFKTFADSVRDISRLGKRLATLEADVAAIKELPVDEKGDVDAAINVGKSVSLHTGLRLQPAVMLDAKHTEICRTTESLKSELNEIIGHAMELVARCEQAPTAPKTTPYLAGAFNRRECEINEMSAKSGASHAPLSEVQEPLTPPRTSIVAAGRS